MPTSSRSQKIRNLLKQVPFAFILFGAIIICMILMLFLPIKFTLNHLTRKPLCDGCNVILISIDTLSALHLPCYGYEKNTAPHLCAFAKKNTYFTHSYAQSYFTLPSHFSIFTGQYPSTHGMLEEDGPPLDPSFLTLPETLKKNGYSTLYFGPTKSNELPLERGIGRGFDYIHPIYDFDRTKGLRAWKDAVNLFQNNIANRKKTFLFLHTYFVHEPYLPSTRTLHFTNDTVAEVPVSENEFFSFSQEYIQYAHDFFRQNPASYDAATYRTYQKFMRAADFESASVLYDELTKTDCPRYCLMRRYFYESRKQNSRDMTYIKSLYDELIFQFDTHLQSILDSLKPQLQKNTILIITADHGEEFMEHGNVFHRSLYGEVNTVPLIVSIPELAGHINETPVQSIDIYPTVLSLLGITPSVTMSGTDLSPIIYRVPFARGAPVIITERYDTRPAFHSFIPIKERGVIADGWKLYIKDIDQTDGKLLELYDIKTDPWDKHTIADVKPEVVHGLLKTHEVFAASHRITYPAAQPVPHPSTTDQTQRYFHY